MEEHLVASASGEFIRKVWLLRGVQPQPPQPQTLCVFLDAEYYLHRMDAASILSDLQTRDPFSPITWVFVSHGDQPARHSDYVCNDAYSRYIAQDVLGWVQNQCEGVAEQDHLICGLSLSGLASAYLALTYPHRFSRALCQSGSFWWNREWLTKKVCEIDSASSQPGKFWLSVGNKEVDKGISHPPSGMLQDVSQRAAAETIAQELTQRRATVHYHLFPGGHEIAPWQSELPAALTWLLQPMLSVNGRRASRPQVR